MDEMARTLSPSKMLNVLVDKLSEALISDNHITLTGDSLSTLQLVLRETKISMNDLRGLNDEEKKRLGAVAVLEICLPCLASLCGPSSVSTMEVLEVIVHVAEIVLSVVGLVGADTLVLAVNHILSYLEPSKTLDCNDEQDLVAVSFHQKQLSINLLFQLLRQQSFVDAISEAGVVELVFERLITSIKSSDVTSCYHTASLLLPFLVGREQVRRTMEVWEFIQGVWTKSFTTEMRVVDVVLTLLCCLSDLFFPTTSLVPFTKQASEGIDVCHEKEFWEIIQFGLTDPDPLSRKRCRYLMKRVLTSVKESKYEGDLCSEGDIFWWARKEDEPNVKEVQEVWDGLLLLLETLEEKQVHIIKPVVPRLKGIVAATRKQRKGGGSVMHISWLMVVLKRVFVHESKSVIQWGVKECLEMDLTGSPVLLRENWKGLLIPLMEVLSGSSVFAKENHSDLTEVCPATASSLVQFLISFMAQLPKTEKGAFLCVFLRVCADKNLSDVPLVYISYAVSQLASSSENVNTSLLGVEGLAAMRSLLLTGLQTHRKSHRAAIQCFLLTTFCQLADTTVSLAELFGIFGCFRGNECLVYHSPAWREAREWLCRLANSKDSLRSFFAKAVSALLKEPSSGKLSPLLGPEQLARGLLLTIDAEINSGKRIISTSADSLQEAISAILGPIVELISGARTRVYLSTEVLCGAVKLLVSILQLLLARRTLLKDSEKDCAVEVAIYQSLLPWLPSVFSYLQDALLCGTSEPDSRLPSLDDTKLFHSAIDSLYQFLVLSNYSFQTLSDIGPAYLMRKATECLATFDLCKACPLTGQLLGALSTTEWLCSVLSCQLQPNADGCDLFLNEYDHQQLILRLSALPANLQIVQPVSSPDLTGQTEILSCVSGLEVRAQPVHTEWGPVISHCLSCHWRCVLYISRFVHGDACRQFGEELCIKEAPAYRQGMASLGVQEFSSLCLDQLDVAGEEIATPLKCLAILVPKLVEGGFDLLLQHIDNSWSFVSELQDKPRLFLLSLNAFLGVAFHPLLLAATDTAVVEMHRKYAEDVRAIAEVKTGVYNQLVRHVCDVWQGFLLSGEVVVGVQSMRLRSALLLQAALFGPIFKKNLRSTVDVEHFVWSLGDRCSSNQIKWSEPETDNMVRVRLLSFLMELRKLAEGAGESFALLEDFLSEWVCGMVDELRGLSQSRPCYYLNSYTHRLRLRIVQTVILTCQWLDQTHACNVTMAILECLESDNQLSVRYLMEWIVVTLLSTHPSLWKKLLLPQLRKGTGLRLGRLCSIFTIVMHLGKCMSSREQKLDYYLQVFPMVFQWCMCHHFVVRVYAAATVLSMWQECADDKLLGNKDSNTQVDNLLQTLGQFVPFLQQYSDAGKCRKTESNIFFTVVDPVKDFTIETVLHVLPALTNVLEEEWIPASLFTSETWRDTLLIPLVCTNQQLMNAYYKHLKCSFHSNEPVMQRYDPSSEFIAEGSNNVQRKITPWNNRNEVLRELFPGIQPLHVEDEHRGSAHKGKLILVASLLHKAPNLGGLCRTCEIFGVSELVLASGEMVEEKEFKSLSVTAEKWIRISVVSPSMLKQYLQGLRAKGYALVGVEQTAQSKCLTKYHFSQESVLLLGNEREGIPVDLIHILDDCVEIPQFGIIRSLNVHVSGALLVWEYTKQHMFRDKEC